LEDIWDLEISAVRRFGELIEIPYLGSSVQTKVVNGSSHEHYQPLKPDAATGRLTSMVGAGIWHG
jgi:hypothetical protein